MTKKFVFFLILVLSLLVACGSDSDSDSDERPEPPTYDNGTIAFTYPRGWIVDDADGQIAGANSEAALAAQDELTTDTVNFILFEANAVLDFELDSGVEPSAFLAVLLTDTDETIFGDPTITSLGSHPVAYVIGNDGVVDAMLLVIRFENDNYVIMTVFAGDGALGGYQSQLLAIAESMTFAPQPTRVSVTELSWERIITVEQYQTVQAGDWCDSLPSDAFNVVRNQQQRGTRRVPDSQECQEIREDNGEGTLTERTECTTVYREESIFDDFCDYSINRWQVRGHITTSGGPNDELVWGEVNLQGGNELGAERESSRETRYLVELVGEDSGGIYQCPVSEEAWQGMELDSQWTLRVGFLSDTPDCESLQAVID